MDFFAQKEYLMEKRHSVFLLLLLSISFLSMTGCDQTKRTLGLVRERPDEFTVLDHPPLSMPPGVGLKPPQRDALSPHSSQPRLQAKELLLDKSGPEHQHNISPIEEALLKGAKVEESLKSIREVVNNEAKVKKAGKSTIQNIIYWEGKPTGEVIDPQEEYKKLYNKEAPGPLN